MLEKQWVCKAKNTVGICALIVGFISFPTLAQEPISAVDESDLAQTVAVEEVTVEENQDSIEEPVTNSAIDSAEVETDELIQTEESESDITEALLNEVSDDTTVEASTESTSETEFEEAPTDESIVSSNANDQAFTPDAEVIDIEDTPIVINEMGEIDVPASEQLSASENLADESLDEENLVEENLVEENLAEENLAEENLDDESLGIVEDDVILGDESLLDNDVSVDDTAEEPLSGPLSASVEELKKSSLELNRDLLILEEELLFPASTQLVVYLSMDVGKFFKLDSVKLQIEEKIVASHLYTNRQNHALNKGGIQRLYMGNVKNGEHEITAIFTGLGPDNREYKRGATTVIAKDDDTKMIELRIRDSQKNMQPEFDFKEWEL